MENNVLKYLENIIESDFRDWSSNYRDAIIYGIIIGFDDEQYDEIMFKFKSYGFTEEYIEKIKMLHERWELLKFEENEHINTSEFGRETLAIVLNNKNDGKVKVLKCKEPRERKKNEYKRNN